MSRNLAMPPNRDVVQGTLTLEPRECTLDRYPLFQQGFAFEGILNAVINDQPKAVSAQSFR